MIKYVNTSPRVTQRVYRLPWKCCMPWFMLECDFGHTSVISHCDCGWLCCVDGWHNRSHNCPRYFSQFAHKMIYELRERTREWKSHRKNIHIEIETKVFEGWCAVFAWLRCQVAAHPRHLKCVNLWCASVFDTKLLHFAAYVVLLPLARRDIGKPLNVFRMLFWWQYLLSFWWLFFSTITLNACSLQLPNLLLHFGFGSNDDNALMLSIFHFAFYLLHIS